VKSCNVLTAYTALFAAVAASLAVGAQREPQLTVEQQKEFLLNAKVIKSDPAQRLATGCERITLSDGRITHYARFQVYSYPYNLAAYELAQLVGLGDMVPVTVERKLLGQTGALEWFLPIQMIETERIRKKIQPPDASAWNVQMGNVRVFAYLVSDINRHPDNLLIRKDWKLCMIDFSRAFRPYRELDNLRDLVKCSRALFDNLRKLDEAEVTTRTKKYLNSFEIQGVLARRDKIVAHLEKLIAEKGEAQVIH